MKSRRRKGFEAAMNEEKSAQDLMEEQAIAEGDLLSPGPGNESNLELAPMGSQKHSCKIKSVVKPLFHNGKACSEPSDFDDVDDAFLQRNKAYFLFE